MIEDELVKAIVYLKDQLEIEVAAREQAEKYVPHYTFYTFKCYNELQSHNLYYISFGSVPHIYSLFIYSFYYAVLILWNIILKTCLQRQGNSWRETCSVGGTFEADWRQFWAKCAADGMQRAQCPRKWSKTKLAHLISVPPLSFVYLFMHCKILA